jgi:hypothetical protein
VACDSVMAMYAGVAVTVMFWLVSAVAGVTMPIAATSAMIAARAIRGNFLFICLTSFFFLLQD